MSHIKILSTTVSMWSVTLACGLTSAVLVISDATAQATQNSTMTYAYDSRGNLTQITDPLSQITRLSYDAQNRITQEVKPSAIAGAPIPVLKYAYDSSGSLSAVTDPRSLKTTYVTDGLGNLGTLMSPDTGTTKKTYDIAGNVLTSTDALNRVTTYSYDVLSRVVKIAYPTMAATKFEYDGGST